MEFLCDFRRLHGYNVGRCCVAAPLRIRGIHAPFCLVGRVVPLGQESELASPPTREKMIYLGLITLVSSAAYAPNLQGQPAVLRHRCHPRLSAPVAESVAWTDLTEDAK